MTDILRDRLSKVVEKINQPKEPVKYVLHVAESDPWKVCLLGVTFGNERLGSIAVYTSLDVWDVVEKNISQNKSVEISQPMPKDFAESMAVEVAKFAAKGLVTCGCGKGVAFKLVELDGE